MNANIFQWIYGLSHRNFLFDGAGVFLAQYLPYLMVLGVLILIFSEPTWRRRIFFFSELCLALILSRGIITEIVRFFYAHPRPFTVFNFTPLIGESGNSFPSGHAAFFFALTFVIFMINRSWGSVYFGLSVINGLARIFSGVHWPADVIGGMITGLLSGIIVYLLLRPYLKKIKAEEQTV